MDVQNSSVCRGEDLKLDEQKIFSQLTFTKQYLYNKALESMQNKAYFNALKFIEQALQIDGKDSDLLLLAGLCHYALGDLGKAGLFWGESNNSFAQQYQEKTNLEQGAFSLVVAAYNQALGLMKEEKYRKASGVLNHVLKGTLQFLPALELLALAYYSEKKHRKCWEVIGRIREITIDAPVLAKLIPELPDRSCKQWLPYAALLFVAVGTLGYLNLLQRQTSQQTKIRKQVVVKTISKPAVIDETLLRSTAYNLAKQGNYQSSADIFLALAKRKNGKVNPDKQQQLVWSKAAAHYYFLGMEQLRKKEHSKAERYFQQSRRYPVRSYVYDDVLYYQGVARERLGEFNRAAEVYRQLLLEEPTSNYCQSAIIRWGKMANQYPKMRSDFSLVLEKHPEFQSLVSSIVTKWKE